MAQKKQLPQPLKAENLSLKVFLYTVPSVALCVLLINRLFLQQDSLAIVGIPSMAIFAAPLAGILTLALFIIFYIRGPQKIMRESGIVKSKRWVRALDAIGLGILYGFLVIGMTLLAAAVIAGSFKGLRLDIYTSSILVGVSVGIAAYFIVKAVSRITTGQIMNVLSAFLIGGVLISMLTASNPVWWTENFSSLGQSTERYTLSFYAFNVTLVLSGYAVAILARHLFYDMKRLIEINPKSASDRVDFMKMAFILVALGLAGIGLFPFKADAIQGTLHIWSAGFMIVAFGALMIGLRWILPEISKPFLVVSYTALACLVSLLLTYRFTDYLNVTAFELICFVICFTWLYLFTQQIIHSSKPKPTPS